MSKVRLPTWWSSELENWFIVVTSRRLTMTSSGFHIVDYILFSLVLLISVVVGIYHGCRRGRKQTTDEYLLGSRELKMVPVAISMFMSYVSGVLVLGNTAEMYNYGIQYWLACIGSSLAFIFSALVFVPLFFPLRFVSANEVQLPNSFQYVSPFCIFRIIQIMLHNICEDQINVII